METTKNIIQKPPKAHLGTMPNMHTKFGREVMDSFEDLLLSRRLLLIQGLCHVSMETAKKFIHNPYLETMLAMCTKRSAPDMMTTSHIEPMSRLNGNRKNIFQIRL